MIRLRTLSQAIGTVLLTALATGCSEQKEKAVVSEPVRAIAKTEPTVTPAPTPTPVVASLSPTPTPTAEPAKTVASPPAFMDFDIVNDSPKHICDALVQRIKGFTTESELVRLQTRMEQWHQDYLQGTQSGNDEWRKQSLSMMSAMNSLIKACAAKRRALSFNEGSGLYNGATQQMDKFIAEAYYYLQQSAIYAR